MKTPPEIAMAETLFEELKETLHKSGLNFPILIQAQVKIKLLEAVEEGQNLQKDKALTIKVRRKNADPRNPSDPNQPNY